MVTQKEKLEPQKQGSEPRDASLPLKFYQQLLEVPACKRGLPCNNCGSCEH